MTLERYFVPGKIGLLKKEVESSINILLQSMSHWLINEDQIRKQQETNNKCGLVILITMSIRNMPKQLINSSL